MRKNLMMRRKGVKEWEELESEREEEREEEEVQGSSCCCCVRQFELCTRFRPLRGSFDLIGCQIPPQSGAFTCWGNHLVCV